MSHVVYLPLLMTLYGFEHRTKPGFTQVVISAGHELVVCQGNARTFTSVSMVPAFWKTMEQLNDWPVTRACRVCNSMT
jgi:hypothetical protein